MAILPDIPAGSNCSGKRHGRTIGAPGIAKHLGPRHLQCCRSITPWRQRSCFIEQIVS